MQIYEGLPLLTGWPSPDVLGMCPHHLIGAVPVTREFSVADYRSTAVPLIDAEAGRGGRLPVVAGGTGLYMKALTHGLDDGSESSAPPDPRLRGELVATPLEELVARLKRLAPAVAANTDLENPRRVIRAIERAILSGVVEPGGSWARGGPLRRVGVLVFRSRVELERRCRSRLAEIVRAGVFDEIGAALGASATAQKAIGFREGLDVLAGKMTEVEWIERIAVATRQYVKRQLTWLRRQE